MQEAFPGRGGASTEYRALALLPGEPPGKISTVNAGVISFEATLVYPPDEKIPERPAVEELCLPGGKLYGFRFSCEAPGTHRLSCEIRALRTGHLAASLDLVLRRVSEHAALAEAVLEARAVRIASPTAPSAILLERLARHLWEAGYRVSFGPSWDPLPAGTGISVGSHGFNVTLECSLRDRFAW